MSRLGIYARGITATRKLKRAAFFAVALAVVGAGFVHFSPDPRAFADNTVQSTTLPFTPTSIASSQDGTHLVAGQNNTTTQFYVSDNSGVDWTPASVPSSTIAGPQQLVSSSDGQDLFGVYGSRYYMSTDGGLSWTSTTGHNGNVFVSSMAYAANSGVIYAVDWKNGTHQIVSSSDFGQTWTLTYTATFDVNSVAVSADGTKLYDTEFDESTGATTTNVSTDGGATWHIIHQTDASSNLDFNVYSNSDGSLLIISQYSIADQKVVSPIISTDGGTTWQSSTLPAIGQYLYFSGLATYNYTDTDTGTTLYHIAPDSGTPPVQPSAGVNGQSLEGNPTIVTQPTFSGVSQPFAQVTVTVHSNPVTCSTTADSSGAWSCQLPQALPAGTHTVEIDFVNQDASTDHLGPYTVTVPSATTTNTGKAATTPKSVPAPENNTTTDTSQTPSTTTSTPAATTHDTTESTQPIAQSSFNWWIVIAAVIFAAVIIVIILIARRLRR